MRAGWTINGPFRYLYNEKLLYIANDIEPTILLRTYRVDSRRKCQMNLKSKDGRIANYQTKFGIVRLISILVSLNIPPYGEALGRIISLWKTVISKCAQWSHKQVSNSNWLSFDI